jgi:hypothetical protein
MRLVTERRGLENIAKDRKVIPDPIDDRKFQDNEDYAREDSNYSS